MIKSDQITCNFNDPVAKLGQKKSWPQMKVEQIDTTEDNTLNEHNHDKMEELQAHKLIRCSNMHNIFPYVCVVLLDFSRELTALNFSYIIYKYLFGCSCYYY